MSIQFPAIKPASISWGYRRNIAYNTSMGGKVTRIALTGDRWVASLTMPPVTGEDARLLTTFAMRVSEVGGSVLLPMFGYTFPGVAGLTPLVNGAGQSGSTLNIDGLPPNETGIIPAGARMGLATNQVVWVAADADSNGSGEAAVTLTTPIRTSPDENSAVDLYTPKVACILPEGFAEWAISAPLIHTITFQFIEDI